VAVLLLFLQSIGQSRGGQFAVQATLPSLSVPTLDFQKADLYTAMRSESGLKLMLARHPLMTAGMISGPPCVASPDLANYARGLITSCVNGSDVVVSFESDPACPMVGRN
jgi:hypothetical protein